MSLRSTPVLIVIILAVTATCVRLGLWQIDRLSERREANAAAFERRALPPLSLNELSSPQLAESLTDRRVTAEGSFDHSRQVIIRGRLYRETPGVHVVTPLRLGGSDTAVLVNRGFVPAPDALTAELDSLNEEGVRRVTGLALAIPTDSAGGAPLAREGQTTWKRLDLAAIQARLPYPILGVYILEAPDSAQRRYPRRLEARPLDDGPHLSYAIQWFSFATIALVGGLTLVYQELKRGRQTNR